MKIVVLDGFTLNPGDLDWGPLKQMGELTIYDRTSKDQVLDRIIDAEVVLTNKVTFDRELIAKLPNLKLIVVLATGYNNIDISATNRSNITVCNARHYSTNAVAQHTFALLLEMTNRVGQQDDDVKKEGWSSSPDWSYHINPLSELAGKTIGLIGFGNIAQRVSKMAQGFDMQVKVYRKHASKNIEAGVKVVSFPELLATSDIVSLHCPLTDETAAIINKESLALMKPEAILINTSRGPLINEKDLYNALLNMEISGACLDVLVTEPPPTNHPLIGLKNCIVTPHQAWATKASRQRLMDIAITNVAAFTNGNPTNVINHVLG